MDYPKEIGERIKKARLEKGWSLTELSRRTKDVLSHTRISNYETGYRMPGPSEAVILGSALGKRAAYLMAVDDVQLPISSQEETLIRNWRSLPENERMDYFRTLEARSLLYRDAVRDSQLGAAWTAKKKPAHPTRERMPRAKRTPGR